MVIRIIAIAAGLAMLNGCSATDPGSAASIEYRMPKTQALITMNLVLTECGPSPKVKPDITLTEKGGVGSKIYKIDGEDLSNALTKTKFSLSVNDAGVITGVNSAVADRSVAVISNVLKTVTPFVGSSFLNLPDPVCTAETSASLTNVDNLKTQIKAERAKIPTTTNSADLLKIIEAVDAMALEAARIQTKELSITLSAPFSLNSTSNPFTLVNLDYAKIAEKWFVGPQIKTDIASYFGLYWSSRKSVQISGTISPPQKSMNLEECEFSIPVPNVSLAEVQITAANSDMLGFDSETRDVPVAEASNPDELCLSVGFGENRSVELSFDEFGRKKKFTWTSESTAETVTGALPDISSNLAKIRTGIEGDDEPTDLEKQKKKIDELETRQKYNKLLTCEKALEAGGFTCD